LIHQANFYTPFLIRKILGLKPQINAKAMALFSLSFIKLYQLPKDEKYYKEYNECIIPQKLRQKNFAKMQKLEALRQKKESSIIMLKKRTRYDNKFKIKLVLEVLKGEKTLNLCACTLCEKF